MIEKGIKKSIEILKQGCGKEDIHFVNYDKNSEHEGDCGTWSQDEKPEWILCDGCLNAIDRLEEYWNKWFAQDWKKEPTCDKCGQSKDVHPWACPKFVLGGISE